METIKYKVIARTYECEKIKIFDTEQAALIYEYNLLMLISNKLKEIRKSIKWIHKKINNITIITIFDIKEKPPYISTYIRPARVND